MKTKYDATIGNYSFLMEHDDVIEVWGDGDDEHPESYIFLKEGSLKTEKDFQMEVSFWYINNIGN